MAIPGAIIGVLAALGLAGVSWAAAALQGVLWEDLPSAVGVGEDSPWWILGVLTATGLAVGVVVRWAPGHAGQDSATTELVAPPLPMSAVPGLAVALALGLAGGVSLGPENPIIAVNVAVAVWLVTRTRFRLPPEVIVLVSASGTIGAMFGTPVGAALLMTGVLAGRGEGPLFDKLFPPLVAAATGSLTMIALGVEQVSIDVPAYADPAWADVLTAPLVAVAAAALCLPALWSFPLLHRAFHRLGPVVMLGLGGLVLGVLGIVGGPLTLFKGLDQMQELTEQADEYGVAALLGFAVVKLVALVVSATAGFRGGRIFPAVFVGVAFGLAVHASFSEVHLGLTVASAVLGTTMVVARDGWLALFMAVTLVGDIAVLPVLCVAVLPLWLLVRSRPLMLVEPTP